MPPPSSSFWASFSSVAWGYPSTHRDSGSLHFVSLSGKMRVSLGCHDNKIQGGESRGEGTHLGSREAGGAAESGPSRVVVPSTRFHGARAVGQHRRWSDLQSRSSRSSKGDRGRPHMGQEPRRARSDTMRGDHRRAWLHQGRHPGRELRDQMRAWGPSHTEKCMSKGLRQRVPGSWSSCLKPQIGLWE